MPRPSRPRILSGAVACLTLALSSCSLLAEDTTPTTTALAPATTTAPEAENPTVLDRGAEPHELLELHPTIGTRITLETSTASTVVQTRQGTAPQTITPPSIRQVLDLRITRVDLGGATIQLTLTDLRAEGDVADEVRAEVEASLAEITGFTATSRISPQGRVHRWDMDLPEGLSREAQIQLEALPDQLTALTPVLPDIPVGIGARWRVPATLTAGGITLSRETTFELVARDGDQIELRTTTTADADRQTVDLVLDQGITARLVEASYLGEGTTSLHLTTLVQQATSSIRGHQLLEVDLAGATETVDQEVEVRSLLLGG